MEENKKPKVMIVGHVGHGITGHVAQIMALGHDISIISPDEAKAMGDDEGLITLPYHAPAPIPILEMPFTISERSDMTFPKTGRQERNEKRKKKRKKNRRY